MRWIGVAPLEYLTQWRVQIACELLKDGDKLVAEVANRVGYESESAFSTAFKRVMGCSPRRYSRGRDLFAAAH